MNEIVRTMNNSVSRESMEGTTKKKKKKKVEG